jgi:hypothetical protein
MVPAQQRFDADRAPRHDVDDRLEHERQLVGRQRTAQVARDAQRGRALRGQLLVPDRRVAVLAPRGLQRAVGAAQQGRAVEPRRGQREAVAPGDLDLGAAGHDRIAQRADDGRRYRPGGVHAVHVGDNRELIAARAPDHHSVRQHRDQPIGEALEHLVAGVMADRVVDVAEVA